MWHNAWIALIFSDYSYIRCLLSNVCVSYVCVYRVFCCAQRLTSSTRSTCCMVQSPSSVRRTHVPSCQRGASMSTTGPMARPSRNLSSVLHPSTSTTSCRGCSVSWMMSHSSHPGLVCVCLSVCLSLSCTLPCVCVMYFIFLAEFCKL